MSSVLFAAILTTASLVQSISAPPGVASPTISGKVVDKDQRPLPGATVWLWQDRDVKKTETDAQGAFSFSDLAPIPSDLIVRKDEYALAGVSVDIAGLGPVVIVLNPEIDSLRVCLKDESFQPIPGARLRSAFINDTFELPVEDLVEYGFPDIRSDEQGHLVVPNMPKNGYAKLVFGHLRFADKNIVYLPAGEDEKVIVLQPGVELRGRVTNPEKAGVPRARVGVFRLGSEGRREVSETLTDPEGFYHFVVKPGDCFVAVRHPAYASPVPRAITLKPDEEPPALDLNLSEGYDIAGRTVLPDGAPVPGVAITFFIGKSEYEEVLTQCDGSFHLCVPQTEGRIHIRPPDGLMTENLAEIPIKGQLQKKTALEPIRLKPLPLIEGTVVDETGAKQPNVLISSLDKRIAFWTRTDADGKFSMVLRRMPETVADPEVPNAPVDPRSVKFRAEHAQRFLRADFDILLDQVKPVNLTLTAFDPNIAMHSDEHNQNDLSALVGKPAPQLSCDAWINSEAVKIESLRGKVVLLFFWAGFDKRPEAFNQIEELRALYDLLQPAEDIVFIGIHDGGEDTDKIQKYVTDLGIKFPVGRDGEPFTTFEQYKMRYIPQIILVDKHGKVRYDKVQGRLLELIKSLRREGM